MRRPTPPNTITIIILTTITIIFWVFFSVYRILTTQAEQPVPPEVLEPINPTLDTATLDALEGKLLFTNSELTEIVVATPTPTGGALEENLESEGTGGDTESMTEGGLETTPSESGPTPTVTITS